LLRWLITVASLALAASQPAAALDAVSIQLKWKHQFQFAGYYQALEQGFYRDAGLDVTIREGGPAIDASEAVAGGTANFGVCSASVLRDWGAGRRLVVLAAIFQHSAAVILVPRRADISSVVDLRGRTLMDTPGSDDIAAMLKREGIDYQSMPRVPHEGNPRDLLAGRADAMVAYSTNEPFVLEQLGAAYRTFSPATSGIDFYGDNLCASEAEARTHPDRTASFRSASLKGWAYALAHKEATADLILRKYSVEKSRAALLFEAQQTAPLVGTDDGGIGEQDLARWQSIAAIYRQLGMTPDDTVPAGLIWASNDDSMRRRIIPWMFVLAGLGIAVLAGYRNRRLSRNAAAESTGFLFPAEAAKVELDHVAAVYRAQHSRSRFHPDLQLQQELGRHCLDPGRRGSADQPSQP
jgi:ABC-type nitrate/sulfonate/bicarbonate transport system substrate-binding protein